MKYNIKVENSFGRTMRDIVLSNRNLTEKDVVKLLNYDLGSVTESPYKLENMGEAVQLFMQEYDKEAKIGFVVDADVDGHTSSALLYLFLKESNYPLNKIQIFHHEGKMHGLGDEKLFKQIKKSDVEFLIIADAGTNDEKQLKELMNLNKRILILDHHIKEKDTNMKEIYKNQIGELIFVLVNNQLGEYCKDFSGVGVCWKFLTALLQKEWVHHDIVAIGNIADMMNINNDLELRALINKGLDNVTNPFFKAFLEDAGIENPTPMDISFNLANYINGVIRFGKTEDKVDLFRALIGEQEEFTYKPRKSKNNPNPTEQIETLQQHMVRKSKSIKQSQDKKKKECVKLCKQYIDDNNIDENKVIVVIDKDMKMVDKRITGLIATNLVDIYKKPVVLLSYSSKQDKYTGSMRGYGTESFKKLLEATEIIKVIGHDNSAGVEVQKKDIPRLIKRINKVMEDIELKEPAIDIDTVLDLKEISFKQMNDVLELSMLFNSFCPKPQFLIKDKEINLKDIRNPYPTLLAFELDGIQFKKEYCSGAFKSEFLCEEETKNIFGRPDIVIDEMVVEIGYDDFKKQPCFLLKSAKTHVKEKNDKKKNKNIPF